jgi:hypothetical protein
MHPVKTFARLGRVSLLLSPRASLIEPGIAAGKRENFASRQVSYLARSQHRSPNSRKETEDRGSGSQSVLSSQVCDGVSPAQTPEHLLKAMHPDTLNPLGMIVPIGKHTTSFAFPCRDRASTFTCHTIFDIECAKGRTLTGHML